VTPSHHELVIASVVLAILAIVVIIHTWRNW
jgi:hypothetical protein